MTITVGRELHGLLMCAATVPGGHQNHKEKSCLCKEQTQTTQCKISLTFQRDERIRSKIT